MAMTGDASVIRIGNATAAARMRTATCRFTATSGDDSSTTGKSVIAGMFQSETMPTCPATATITGSSTGTAKAISASRRGGCFGDKVSVTAARLGRVAAHASTTGT